MIKIRARATLRVSYAGGGTDVPPYPGLKGGVVLSSTIQNYAYCSITPRSDGMVTVSRKTRMFRSDPRDLVISRGVESWSLFVRSPSGLQWSRVLTQASGMTLSLARGWDPHRHSALLS